MQLKQKTNAVEEEEEKLQRKLTTEGNMLVHLKGKVNKGEIENTKNKSGGNGGIGFPESTTVTKFVEPTLDEKLRNMSSAILTAITQTVDAKLTKFDQTEDQQFT